MILKDISFTDPIKNLLYDDVLLHLADKVEPQEYLRFWMSPVYFAVLGRISKEEEDINFEAMKADGVEVLRRSSGGGTVIQGPGCLNFAVVADKNKNKSLDDLKQSYVIILENIKEALRACGVETKVMPISDVALLNDKKISGNAQKRGRRFILHHGTVLCDFDLSVIKKYLHMPTQMPDYREGREHLAFVDNCGLSVEEVKKSIQSVFTPEQVMTDLNDSERQLLDEFVAQRADKMRCSY